MLESHHRLHHYRDRCDLHPPLEIGRHAILTPVLSQYVFYVIIPISEIRPIIHHDGLQLQQAYLR